MKANRLIKFLSNRQPLPPRFVEIVQNSVRPATFPKGHHLVQAQSVATHLHFLETGFAAEFCYERERRVVTDFWQAGEMILSARSFFDQVPTDQIVELAVQSRVHSIPYRIFSELTQRFPVTNALIRDMVLHYYGRCEQRILDIHTLDTWERYLKLLEMYPGIELRISQEMIASYLNVTPSYLSRIKAINHS